MEKKIFFSDASIGKFTVLHFKYAAHCFAFLCPTPTQPLAAMQIPAVSCRPLTCVEVGSGSGVVLAFLARLLSVPSFHWLVFMRLPLALYRPSFRTLFWVGQNGRWGKPGQE